MMMSQIFLTGSLWTHIGCNYVKSLRLPGLIVLVADKELGMITGNMFSKMCSNSNQRKNPEEGAPELEYLFGSVDV